MRNILGEEGFSSWIDSLSGNTEAIRANTEAYANAKPQEE
jgi:hypothetical protein